MVDTGQLVRPPPLTRALRATTMIYMGAFDDMMDKAKDLADKAQDLAQEHPEQLDQAVDRAGDMLDKATGGKFSEHIDNAGDTVVERLTDRN